MVPTPILVLAAIVFTLLLVYEDDLGVWGILGSIGVAGVVLLAIFRGVKHYKGGRGSSG